MWVRERRDGNGWTVRLGPDRAGVLAQVSCLLQGRLEDARIGNTPLRDVADACSLAVATFLVDSGADPRIPGWMQLTALHKTKERKDQDGQRVYALLKSVADRLGDS
jgi:hypothetical protein